MLRDYLKAQRQVFVKDNEGIDLRLGEIHTKRIENIKFLEMLRSEGDVFFTDFTPRDVNNKNIAKIRELEAELTDLEKEEQSLRDQKSYNESKISMLLDCMEEFRDLRKCEAKLDDMKSELEELQRTSSENNEDSDLLSQSEAEEQLAMVKRTIGRILNFLPTAPIRAREELVKLQREL